MLHICVTPIITLPTCPTINVMRPPWYTFMGCYNIQMLCIPPKQCVCDFCHSHSPPQSLPYTRCGLVFIAETPCVLSDVGTELLHTMYINCSVDVSVLPDFYDPLVIINTTRHKRNSTYCCPQAAPLLLLYALQDKQRLVLWKKLTDWPLWLTVSTFTARYQPNI